MHFVSFLKNSIQLTVNASPCRVSQKSVIAWREEIRGQVTALVSERLSIGDSKEKQQSETRNECGARRHACPYPCPTVEGLSPLCPLVADVGGEEVGPKMRRGALSINFDKLAKAEGVVTVVRLAMVCNDLAIANSSMGGYKQGRSSPLDHIRRGAQMYFARLSCGHLTEGMEAIEEVRGHPALSALTKLCSPRAQSAFVDLCDRLRGGKEQRKLQRFVGWIRNRVAFHYDANDLRWALENRVSRSAAWTSGGDIHPERFEFGDDLLDTIVCRKFWGIPVSVNFRAEADRIAGWCEEKCLRFLAKALTAKTHRVENRTSEPTETSPGRATKRADPIPEAIPPLILERPT